MNGVAAVIWELLSQNAGDVDALCLAVHERFPDATPEQIRADTLELLDDLAKSGLLENTPAESAA
jgi:hypothetical protein